MKYLALSLLALLGLTATAWGDGFLSAQVPSGTPSMGSVCELSIGGLAVICSPSNPVPSSTITSTAPTTNISGTVTTGGTFQQIAAANTSRKSFEFENNNPSDNCYVYFGATASATLANSLKVVPGAYYGRLSGVVPSDAIQVTCQAAGDTFWAEAQ